MIEIFKLFSFNHPWMFFVIVLAAVTSLYEITYTIAFKLPNRFLRSRNIRERGWPPAHCDADGDGLVMETEEKD